MYRTSFSEAEQALGAAEAAVSAAEGHGCLCGALCTLAHFPSQSWLQELLPDPAEINGVFSEPVDPALQQLYTDTQTALRGDEMEFAPLLPADESPINERIAALAQWSQGFLYGFGIGTPGNTQQFSGDVTEVLQDLSEIARVGDAETEKGDDEEQAYTELVEYLRAAVQLIHDELAEQRAEQALLQPMAH
jgi:uncharacterized protein